MNEMESLKELVNIQRDVKELRDRVHPDSPIWGVCNEVIGAIDRGISAVMGGGK